MDELQDAIQDAQYMGAVSEKAPKPTRPLILPEKADAIVAQKKSQSTVSKGPLSFPYIMNDYLGFYQLKLYLKFIKSPCLLNLECLELIDLFRCIQLMSRRISEAEMLIERFTASRKLAGRSSVAASNEKKSDNDFVPFVIRCAVDEKLFEAAVPERVETYCGVGGAIIDEISKKIKDAKAEGEKNPSRFDDDSNELIGSNLFDPIYNALAKNIANLHYKDFIESEQCKKLVQYSTLEDKVCSEDDFGLYRVLGRGGFGMVNGCKRKDTGKLYAMKVMNKKRVKTNKAEDLCWSERKVLGKINSRFVLSLKYAFHSKDDLFLIMDVMTGGDMAFHLTNEGKFDIVRVKFYAAQVLLGLEHLHSLNIVYRDLKPQNILFGDDGNCAITDLGLACEVTPKLSGRCGTRGYWAPEMLAKVDGKRMTYGLEVDWWSFGCLIYEMICGKCPYRTAEAKALDEDPQKAMDKATLEYDPPYDSEFFDDESADLLKLLFNRDPLLRLGHNGAREIKRHKFFHSIDWGQIETGRGRPPWKPKKDINAASQDSIGAFEDLKKVKLEAEDQAQYEGWNYVSKVAVQMELVEFLQWEEKKGPIKPDEEGCCVIL